MSNGSRIVALDSHRDWGWHIVNYQFYRKIRDQEVRREYFRDAQRKSRKNKKGVKDKVLTSVDSVDGVGQVLTSPSSSPSTSSSYLEDLKKNPIHALIDIDRELEKAGQWCKKKNRKLTQRFFNNWLKKADRSIPMPKAKSQPMVPVNDTPPDEREKILAAGRDAIGKLSQQFKMP
jgi:hypothetical protein